MYEVNIKIKYQKKAITRRFSYKKRFTKLKTASSLSFKEMHLQRNMQ